jgi:hypothetical protein
MRALRKLVLGETWVLPLGVFATLAVGLTLEWVADGARWWERFGGFVLLACVLVALAASLAPARGRGRGRGRRRS